MAENTIITLTSPEGATLNTAGTYCEGDIEVIPKLQEKTATTGEVVTADAGYAGLKSVDTTPVFEAGKKSEYDAFWDDYQTNGRRSIYLEAFAGHGWSEKIFKPKYDIRPSGQSSAINMFQNNASLVDIYAPLDEKGIVLDFSNCADMGYCFNGARNILYLRVIDCRLCPNLMYVFSGMRSCVTIEKIILSPNTQFSGTFNGSVALENLTIEGTIGQNGLNLSWSPLNKASLTSVVNALSSTTTGLAVTLRLAAVNTAFETSAGVADGSTSEEWLALAATKPNWTINLLNT